MTKTIKHNYYFIIFYCKLYRKIGDFSADLVPLGLRLRGGALFDLEGDNLSGVKPLSTLGERAMLEEDDTPIRGKITAVSDSVGKEVAHP